MMLGGYHLKVYIIFNCEVVMLYIPGNVLESIIESNMKRFDVPVNGTCVIFCSCGHVILRFMGIYFRPYKHQITLNST